jgi:hypothetical protein
LFKAIEAKKVGGRLTALQEKDRDSILEAGGAHMVYDGTIPDDLVHIFLFGEITEYGSME